MVTTFPELEKIVGQEVRIPKEFRANCDECLHEFDIRNAVRGSYGGVYCTDQCKTNYTEA